MTINLSTVLQSATTVSPTIGGTGVANNAAMTVTGSGNYAYTRTLTGATNVTFPTSGTLAVLGANTFTGDQTYGDNKIVQAMCKDLGWTVVDKGNSSTATQTYDYTAGSVQTSTATGNHTIAFSNPPPTGNLGELLLIGTNFGAYTITWPTISWIKPDGTTTTSVATYLAANTGRTAFQTSGVDQLLFWTRDAGTTWYAKLI